MASRRRTLRVGLLVDPGQVMTPPDIWTVWTEVPQAILQPLTPLRVVSMAVINRRSLTGVWMNLGSGAVTST